MHFVLHPVLTEPYIRILRTCPLILSKPFVSVRLHPIRYCNGRRITCANKYVSIWLLGKLEAEEL